MKITNKKTILFFKSKNDQKEAENFLLNLNIKFRSALVNNWVEIAPKEYKKNHIDLYIPYHVGVSTYNYKY